MTSETFIVGGPIVEKIAIGARVGRFAAALGPGHVEASVENRGNRRVVSEAHAYPLTAREYDIRSKLEQHLNENKPESWFRLPESASGSSHGR
jgi:hypothetical protein